MRNLFCSSCIICTVAHMLVALVKIFMYRREYIPDIVGLSSVHWMTVSWSAKSPLHVNVRLWPLLTISISSPIFAMSLQIRWKSTEGMGVFMVMVILGTSIWFSLMSNSLSANFVQVFFCSLWISMFMYSLQFMDMINTSLLVMVFNNLYTFVMFTPVSISLSHEYSSKFSAGKHMSMREVLAVSRVTRYIPLGLK